MTPTATPRMHVANALEPGWRLVELPAFWHLLSLDAPCVAVAWTWLLTRSRPPAHRPALLVSMFLAVWMLYAADRLLDARQGSSRLEARHRFHARHARAFAVGLGLAGLALLPLVTLLPRYELMLYVALASALLVWFSIIHGWARRRHDALPKNLIVAAFFASATAIPAWCAQSLPPPQLLLTAALFGGVCLLNCMRIEAWEGESPGRRAQTLDGLLLAGCTLSALFLPDSRAAAVCIGLSVLLLRGLHARRGRFTATFLRAAADAALLTPLLMPCALLIGRLVQEL